MEPVNQKLSALKRYFPFQKTLSPCLTQRPWEAKGASPNLELQHSGSDHSSPHAECCPIFKRDQSVTPNVEQNSNSAICPLTFEASFRMAAILYCWNKSSHFSSEVLLYNFSLA